MTDLSNNPQYKSLQEFGCDETLSKAAVLKTKSQDLGTLIDWIQNQVGNQQKWKKWLEQRQNAPQQEKQENQANMKSISHLINAQFAAMLISQGFSKNVAQKSLLLTGNSSIESAKNWIEEHKYDPDFQEQLFLQGQAHQQSQLTQQEAKQRLKQLTEIARQRRKQRQQQEARERQKNRLRYGKQMIEAKRIAEEQALKRQMQLDRIQKKKDQEYKAKLVEQMRRQRNAKLGIKDEEVKVKKQEQKPKLNLMQQFQLQCQQVYVGMTAHPQKARVFFETAGKIISNIIKNNGQQKFRKINLNNPNIQTRIVDCFGGVQALKVIGFQQQEGTLMMHKWDAGQLTSASNIINKYLQYY